MIRKRGKQANWLSAAVRGVLAVAACGMFAAENAGTPAVKVEPSAAFSPVKAFGYGFIDTRILLETNRFTLSKGVLSYYNDAIVDAEKIEGTKLDDRGCGEATGANMAVMTGWAQMVGFANEDELFRTFYRIDGTASYGISSVIRHVFSKLSDYAIADYYAVLRKFDENAFPTIESWMDKGCAVGLLYLHGTPAMHKGNHVVTLWGICKDSRYPADDPRHYAAVIVSNSDDDKRGYAKAEEAPNRLTIFPVRWDERDKVYFIANGYFARAISLAPPPRVRSDQKKPNPQSVSAGRAASGDDRRVRPQH